MPTPEQFQKLHELVDADPAKQPTDVPDEPKKKVARTSFAQTTSTAAIVSHGDAMERWRRENENEPPKSRFDALRERHKKQF